MGVFYDVRAHIADAQDDYVGKKGSTVCLGIRKVIYIFLYFRFCKKAKRLIKKLHFSLIN